MGRNEIGTKLGTSLRKIQDKTWDRPWQEVYYVPYKTRGQWPFRPAATWAMDGLLRDHKS